MGVQSLSPIIIFAFNRPTTLTMTIEALLRNPEAKYSNLFIFVDGHRCDKDGEKEKVDNVRKIASAIRGFKSIDCIFSNTNKGLGPSIISGVSEIIFKYGKVIVLEDDLVVQPNFLRFMNEGLNKYKTNEEVFSICGYTNRITTPKKYQYDAYFCTRSSSWGWGTWADRWQSVDWSFDNWEKWRKYKKSFNQWGGSDCFGMLRGCKEGKNKSWAIRFCFAQFLQNKLSLFPIKSLVNNNGFDGEGTNCKKYSRFKFELMPPGKNKFILPSKIELDKSFYRQALRYHTILIRLWSRVMYLINK